PGAIIDRIDGDVTQLSNFFSQLGIIIVGNIVMFIGIIVVLTIEDWRLGLAFGIFAMLMLGVLNWIRNIAVEAQKAWREANMTLFGFIEERLAGTEDIRSSGAVDYVLSKLDQLQSVVRKTQQSAWYRFIAIHTTAGFMMRLGGAVAIIASWLLFQNELLTIGTVYLVFHYYNLLGRPIRELSQQVENLQTVGASMERLEDLLAEAPKIKDGIGIPIPEGALTVQFDDVQFAYKADEPILKGISFDLQAGQILGLLGRTGSGKTTIARLLFHLYEQQSGAIRLGDVDIRDVTLAQLRQRVAMVTQDVQLFEATIRDNLTFFNRDISDDRLMSVIQELELKEWLDSLPDGLDTVLETGGRSLSAGEAQLLAFTRIFLRDPGLVILDEASSRLDPATEQLIERAINRLLKGRTGIIIAHRLGTIERADQILILQDGDVIEYGNRTDLAADPNSRFYQLRQTGLEEVLA
ncbi:MAG: ABC transporter ATP-binding protein, partial [Chloroflexota bacterium]